MVTSNIFVGEGQWKIAKRPSSVSKRSICTPNRTRGDWIADCSSSLAPHWMITVSDNYNSGKGNNYYEVLGTYAYKANRFTFGYGQSERGL